MRCSICGGHFPAAMFLIQHKHQGRIVEMDNFAQRVANGVLLVVVALILLAIAIG